MRRIVVAVFLLLLSSACAGGSDDATEPHPSYTSPTVPEPPAETTPSVASTTSTTEATTTTVGPWTTLPEPVCPSAVLAAELGGPAAIETMCLEVATGEQVPPSDEVGRGLADVLDLLGVDAVAQGCQATLRLAVSGHRTSELYSWGVGGSTMRCGTGLVLSGESSLVVDGVVRRTWTANVDNPPPATTQTCPDESAPLSGDEWDDDLVTAPLVEMFGDVAGYAEWVAFIPDHIDVDTRPAPTGDEVQWLTCWLTDGKTAALARLERLAQIEGNEPSLSPLVPYLIAMLDSAQNCTSCSSAAEAEEAESMVSRLNFILGQILGIVFPDTSPAQEFWEFWQQRQGG